ncbi:LssY C-terminal domain-containing protein [Devriesea agamarum]|uniref:LssY C-terminal domain-containing protein n=1 Tax=Devriesea agamarum TaxID=472569 RepID=UPI000A040AC4|nr:LssY C-terminal domain-containing protein [Devriesea agamarum]
MNEARYDVRVRLAGSSSPSAPPVRRRRAKHYSSKISVKSADRRRPRKVPVYHHPTRRVRSTRHWEFYPLLDALFVAAAGAITVWLAIVYLRQGFSLSPTRLLYLLVFWVMLSYLTLPRLHQVLTWLYLPDYFIGRTRTSDGVLGDPVNLAMDGDEWDIHVAMRRAGWVLADEITLRSSWKMAISTVFRRSYAAAPVSSLFLFGRRHDFAYQQEVGGSTTRRHHVRFWRVPDGWVLPGGHRAQWLAAGTFDRAVGLSMFTLQITHKIDEDIDVERDYIIDTLRYADPEVEVRTIKDFSTAYHDRNGGGDRLRTDGHLPVINLTGASERSQGSTAMMLPRHRPTGIAVIGSRTLAVHHSNRRISGHVHDALDNAIDHHLPPPTIVFTALLAMLQVLAIAGMWIAGNLDLDLDSIVQDLAVLLPSGISFAWTGIVATVVAAVALLLVLGTIARNRWCRLGLMALYLGDAVLRLVLMSGLDRSQIHHSELVGVGLSAMALMAITSDAARLWVRTPSE